MNFDGVLGGVRDGIMDKLGDGVFKPVGEQTTPIAIELSALLKGISAKDKFIGKADTVTITSTNNKNTMISGRSTNNIKTLYLKDTMDLSAMNILPKTIKRFCMTSYNLVVNVLQI